MAGISSAVVTTITAEKPSARNATPSGGAQPPTKYCNTLPGAPDAGSNRDRDGEPDRHYRDGDALRIAPA